jgi:hypothetical protein
VEDWLIFADIRRRTRKPFRTPEEQLAIIFCKFIVRSVVERSRRTIVRAKMAKTASSVPILRESSLGVLRMLLGLVDQRNKADAAFWAYPRTDSTSCALVEVEEVSAAEAFW